MINTDLKMVISRPERVMKIDQILKHFYLMNVHFTSFNRLEISYLVDMCE